MLERYNPQDAARILVVDDEEVICDILKDFLEYEGFEVEACQSGEDAIAKLGVEGIRMRVSSVKRGAMPK